MTLPASGPISLTQVMGELRASNPGRAFPISLGDSDVRALAGVQSGPISLSQLHGKSSIIPLNVTPQSSTNNSYNSTLQPGTASAYPSVSVTGGSGNYSYLWSVLSNSGTATLNNPTAATCRLSVDFRKLTTGFFDYFLRCQVTDNVYGISTTVDNVEGYAEWNNNQ